MNGDQFGGLVADLDLAKIDRVITQVDLEGSRRTTTIKEQVVAALTTHLEAHHAHHIRDLGLVRHLDQKGTLGGNGAALRIQHKRRLLEIIINDLLDAELGRHLRLVLDRDLLRHALTCMYASSHNTT